MTRILNRLRLLTWPAVLLAVLVGGLGGMVGTRIATDGRPMVVRDVHEVDGVAIRGDWLELDVTAKRERLCVATVERWLWQENAEGLRRWVPLPAVASPPSPVGVEVHYRVSLPIPANIPAGQWHYLSRTRDECQQPWSLDSPRIRESMDVPVMIIDPPVTGPTQVVMPAGPVTILPLPAPR